MYGLHIVFASWVVALFLYSAFLVYRRIIWMQLRREMLARGRYLDWKCIEKIIDDRKGAYLIVYGGNDWGVWWIPDWPPNYDVDEHREVCCLTPLSPRNSVHYFRKRFGELKLVGHSMYSEIAIPAAAKSAQPTVKDVAAQAIVKPPEEPEA